MRSEYREFQTTPIFLSHRIRQRGNNVAYLINQDTPFSGQTQAFYAVVDEKNYNVPGSKKLDLNFKNGRIDGQMMSWYSDGQKESQTIWVDGKLKKIVMRWDWNGVSRPDLTSEKYIYTLARCLLSYTNVDAELEPEYKYREEFRFKRWHFVVLLFVTYFIYELFIVR